MPNLLAERLLDQAGGQVKAGNHASAAQLVSQALQIDPKNLRALGYGANLAALSGQKDRALNLIGQALKLARDQPAVMQDAASVFFQCGQPHRAARLWERLIELLPHPVELLWNLANYHAAEDDAGNAEKYYRKVMDLAPNRAGVRENIGYWIKRGGRIEEAVAWYREAARLHPQEMPQASRYLNCLHFDPAYSPEQINSEQAAWGRVMEVAVAGASAHGNDRSPDRRLRVGYVSPNFRGHVVGYNLLPLFRHHDHAQFEIYCYSDTRRPDELTAALREGADIWRDTAGLPDAELAAQVSLDRIDVLVDLVLHLEGGRLGMFARKPAPIQVTWMAYPGSSGLSRMDYRLTDPVLDPPGATDHFYTEQSIRLETFWCFEPPANSPSVGPLPMEKKGHVTFGCLNNFAKVNDASLELWREILAAVPGSRLMLMPPKGNTIARVREKLGVAPSRLMGLPGHARLEYLKYYQRIDLALDSYPYTGHTTTLESLWMGVPVVTLAGPAIVSRGSLSILSNLGLTELAVRNKPDYVALAVALAQNRSRLHELRAGLRGQMECSVLMDASRFARQAESAYRGMWHKWCETAPAA